MKSILNYIFEYKDNTIHENMITLTYDVTAQYNHQFTLMCPGRYSESDVQLYLDDALLQQLPSGDELKEKLFGENSKYIADAYFKYKSFHHTKDEPNAVDLKWDSHYDQNVKKDSLEYFQLRDLQYIVVFDEFELINTKPEDADKNLEKLFKSTESNNLNKYPVEIKLVDINIED